MRSWLNILALGTWLVAAWPCYGKVYEIGLEEQSIDIDEVKYFIEPASVPLNIEKFKDFGNWKMEDDLPILGSTQITNQRIVVSFDLSTKFAMPIYFNYTWSSPLNFQKFLALDNTGKVFDTAVVRKTALLASAYLPAGHYKILFIAEPRRFSNAKLGSLRIMNYSFISGTYANESKIMMLIFGIGLAFIFFNFSMFLLHRKSYFIYYVGYSLSVLHLLTVGHGDIPQGNAIFWNLSLFLNCFFTVLMSSSVLRLKEFYPNLLRAAFLLCGISCLLLMTQYIDSSFNWYFIGVLPGILGYVLCIFAAVRRMQSGYIPARKATRFHFFAS